MKTEEDRIKESNNLIKKLGWSTDQCRKHLEDLFHKRSRLILTDEEWPQYIDQLKQEVISLAIFPKDREHISLRLELEREIKGKSVLFEINRYIARKYKHISHHFLKKEQLRELLTLLKGLTGTPEEMAQQLSELSKTQNIKQTQENAGK